jgi:pimeloyl-ACP methyl ester carboxylesterase
VTALTAHGIAYDRAGPRGELTVVLIHAGVADRRMWDAIWAELTDERDVVRLDLRGFGDSVARPAGSLSHQGDLDAAVEANLAWWAEGPRRSADQVDPSLREQVRRMQRRAFEVTADWDDVAEQELDPPALDRLGEIAIPVLVLVGGLGLDTVHDAAGRVVAGIAGARRVDWPDAGHLPSLEDPAAFADLVLDWVADI